MNRAACLIIYGDYQRYNEPITNFAMNFGLAWHFVASFKEQYEIWLKLKLYKPYSMVSFLKEEQVRFKMDSPEDALKYLAEAYIIESEKSLEKIAKHSQHVKEFVEGQLLKITEIDKLELLPKLKI
jgi:hypothetical protein